MLSPQFGWGDFLAISILLALLYFALNFISIILKKFGWTKGLRQILNTILDRVLLFYEPIALLILSCVFILINPVFHGLILFLFLLGSLNAIKNFLNGRLFQFNDTVGIGKRLKTQNTEGVIARIGRLSLELRTKEGLALLPYSSLLSQGYIMMSGEEIGGFHQLLISPNDPEEKVDYEKRLFDLLATAPYLDRNHKTDLRTVGHRGYEFSAKILVKEDGHLRDLITLIEENNYSCSLDKVEN